MSIDAFGRLNGSIELIVAALLAVKPWFPKASVVGGVFASLFFVTTLSFMVTTPGVGEASADPLAVLGADRMPGARLWMYTNFHCNLACDYCCVASSPQSPRRELGAERIARLAKEADWGVHAIFLTGGEPFLLPDIGTIVRSCAALLPTTVLTNAMVFRGRGLRELDSVPRGGVALQISLDSATSEAHDAHRGRGSWAKAVAGIRLALEMGFRVRVAADGRRAGAG